MPNSTHEDSSQAEPIVLPIKTDAPKPLDAWEYAGSPYMDPNDRRRRPAAASTDFIAWPTWKKLALLACLGLVILAASAIIFWFQTL